VIRWRRDPWWYLAKVSILKLRSEGGAPIVLPRRKLQAMLDHLAAHLPLEARRKPAHELNQRSRSMLGFEWETALLFGFSHIGKIGYETRAQAGSWPEQCPNCRACAGRLRSFSPTLGAKIGRRDDRRKSRPEDHRVQPVVKLDGAPRSACADRAILRFPSIR